MIDVPNYNKNSNEIPVTYVPARNIIFLSYAIGYAEIVDANEIYIGVNAIDYSGYPDCRPEFISAFEKMMNIGTKKGIEGNRTTINTPLINMTKADIIKLAYENNAPIHLTTSCYNGKDVACGKCDSCMLRLKGFKEANLKDPIKYF
jgi:7-cyano-7-deazaguanine synthase